MRSQNNIGLDIGESTVKLVQLSSEGEKFKLSAVGIAESPIRSDSPESDKQAVDLIKKLLADTHARGKSVVMSLPESQVYTRVVEMPYLEEPELSSTIKWQAEQYIPVALSDVALKHQILALPDMKVPGSKMTVLLVAAPTALVNRYASIVARAGLEAVAIETEIFAVARSLVATDNFPFVSLLVNFGVDSTTLAVLKKGDLALTQSVSTGGAAINRTLSSDLGLNVAQAEEYKKTYGLLDDKLDGKVKTSIKPIIDQVLAEVKKVITYGETRSGSEPIKRVVLTGGNALIPGLLAYFSANLGLEVQLGNPFVKVLLTDRQREAVFEAGPIFAAAVGLALKNT